MKRFTFVIFLLLILTASYFWMNRTSYVGQFLSNQLNANVTVSSVTFRNKRCEIEGLRIENPPHSKQPYALQVEKMEVEIHPLRLLNKQIFINQITLQNPHLDLELFNGLGNENNLTTFLNALPSGANHFLIVNKLRLENLKIQVARSYGRPLAIPSIPVLEFDQLGEKNPLNIPEVSRLLFQTILMTLSTKPHLSAVLDNVEGLPQNLLKTTAQDPNILQGGMEMIRKKTQEASEFLQGLFG